MTAEPMSASGIGAVESIEPAEDVDNFGNVDHGNTMRSVDMMDFTDSEPVTVVDTTAELLGRAKARRPRPRAAAAATAPRRATKKPASSPARRTSRRKTTAGSKDE